jgi:RimJ/RimL family protein N-acetyltransferase
MFIAGKRINIRYFKDADLDDYFEIVSDEKTFAYEFRSAINFDTAREELINKIETNNSENKSDYFLAVESIDSQKLIGELSLTYIDPEQTIVMLGFAINSHYWRQGYASDMLRLFVNYHFENGGLRVFCSTSGENTACIQLLTKTGFMKEGVLRKSIWAKGKIWDEVFFGMMNDECQP